MVADVTASVTRNVKRKGNDAFRSAECRFENDSIDIAYRDETNAGSFPLFAALPCAETAKGDGSGVTMERANVLVEIRAVKVWVKGRPFFPSRRASLETEAGG